jgi:hypothetical protein
MFRRAGAVLKVWNTLRADTLKVLQQHPEVELHMSLALWERAADSTATEAQLLEAGKDSFCTRMEWEKKMAVWLQDA